MADSTPYGVKVLHQSTTWLVSCICVCGTLGVAVATEVSCFEKPVMCKILFASDLQEVRWLLKCMTPASNGSSKIAAPVQLVYLKGTRLLLSRSATDSSARQGRADCPLSPAECPQLGSCTSTQSQQLQLWLGWRVSEQILPSMTPLWTGTPWLARRGRLVSSDCGRLQSKRSPTAPRQPVSVKELVVFWQTYAAVRYSHCCKPPATICNSQKVVAELHGIWEYAVSGLAAPSH